MGNTFVPRCCNVRPDPASLMHSPGFWGVLVSEAYGFATESGLRMQTLRP